MPDYRIRPDGFKEIKKRIVTRLLVFVSIIGPGSILLMVLNTKNKEQDNYIVIPIVVVLFIAVFFFSIRRAVKKQKELMDSYALVLTENMISRYLINTPTISLYYSEIKEISKTARGIFVIKGKHAEDIIIVPSQIENYEELEERLNNILPVAAYKPKTIFEKYPVPAALLSLALMFGVYGPRNKIVVLACSIPLTGIMIWSFYKIRVSKNLDKRVKRISWWMLLVMLSIIYITILKLIGHYKP